MENGTTTDKLKATLQDLINKNIEHVLFVEDTQKIKQINLLEILLSLKLLAK